jgi:hypothetical protein
MVTLLSVMMILVVALSISMSMSTVALSWLWTTFGCQHNSKQQRKKIITLQINRKTVIKWFGMKPSILI